MSSQTTYAQRFSIAMVLVVGWLVASGTKAPAQESKVAVEKVAYRGWKHALRLSNARAELIITLDVGPRVISYRLNGGKNVFKNYDDQMGKSGEPDWQIRGGHRLWIGPEDLTRTYALDNGPVQATQNTAGQYAVPASGQPGTTYYEMLGPNVSLKPAPDNQYGIQKEMVLAMAPDSAKVTVIHRITNIGKEPTSLAPWALTVLAPGGVEIIPLPAKHPHPGPPKNAKSPKDYAPNQHMTIWPFTNLADPRWKFGARYVTLRQDPKKGPTKIGLAHQMGWVAYLNDGTLFVKRFGYRERDHYPDGGCNFETFTNEDMLEMESLGPVVTVEPGKSVEHIEHWNLIGDVKPFRSQAEIDRNIKARLRGTESH